MTANLYRIDDVLLRAGLVTGVVAALVVLAILGNIDRSGLSLSAATGLFVAVACPMTLLMIGWKMRRREKRVAAVWRLVESQGEVPVQHLCEWSSFGRRQLAAAVKRINRRGNAMLIWDEQAGVIRDGRVQRHRLTHSEDCRSCGGSVSIEVSTGQTDYVCPYCGGGLDSTRINPLLDELQARETRGRRQGLSAGRSGREFSLGLFLLLLLFFWPAAVFYAVKMNGA